MKKIISMLLALMLTCTLCIPVFAAENIVLYNCNETIPQGTCSILFIDGNAKGTIENGKTVTMENGHLSIHGTLVIDGKLDGTVEYIGDCTGSMILGKNGGFQLTFTGDSASYYAQRFIDQLKNSNILYEESTDDSGNIVISSHKYELIIACTGCDYQEEFVTATASTISHGYPEIVYGICGIAIGVVATLLISRKKKATVSSTAAEDKE